MTIHLLKSKAKPTTTDRKRKKVALGSTFTQFLDSKRKKEAESFELNIPGISQPKKSSGNAKQIKDQKMND